MDQYGQKSVYEYAQSFLEPFSRGKGVGRMDEWLPVFEALLTERLGESVAREVTAQLRLVPVVSTADHHSPLDEPYWVNANLVHALIHPLNPGHVSYSIALSFSVVSLNNALGYPRGLLMHDYTLPAHSPLAHYHFYPESDLLKLSLLPDKDKMAVVYRYRPYTEEDVKRLLNSIESKEKEGHINADQAIHLKACVRQLFLAPAIMGQKTFAAQMTALNYQLWPLYFSSPEVPRVVYFEIETLVTELLLRVHLDRPESLFHRLLFDPTWQRAFIREFDGIRGAFASHDQSGTVFFWGLDDKGHRVRLTLQEGQLQSAEKSIVVQLNAAALRVALEKGQIFPSMTLCYLMMAFYYRVRCLGGSNQIRDLARSKEAWQQLLRSVGQNEEAEELTDFPTEDLLGSLGLSTFKMPDGGRVLPTGLDLFLENPHRSFTQISELAHRLTVHSAIMVYLKDLYNDYCKELPFPIQDLDVRN